MHRYKKTAYGLAALLLIVVSGYWFFMHTVTGGGIALYTFAGFHAPLTLHSTCGFETDTRVHEKFEAPLAFDKKSIDGLKGFWQYSYFRECLYKNGYDFSGRPIPHSVVTSQDGISLYQNSYVGFRFEVLYDSVLVVDNALNVDYDDRLLVSSLKIGTTTVIVESSTKHDVFKTFADVRDSYRDNAFSKTAIDSSTERKSLGGLSVLHILEVDGTTRLVFVLPNGYVVNIHSKDISNEILEKMLLSLQNL